jgi:hypothetical protein
MVGQTGLEEQEGGLCYPATEADAFKDDILDPHNEVGATPSVDVVNAKPEELGRGKRRKIDNQLYADVTKFWRHDAGSESDEGF